MTYAYDEATLDLLRLTIKTHGILVPVLYRSGTNEIIDGRHRLKVLEEFKSEGIEMTLPIRHIDTDEPSQIDAIVNSVRRPWQDTEQRRELVAKLRQKGHSNQRIADAVGVNEKTIRRDIKRSPAGPEFAGPAARSNRTSTGKDGKTYKKPALPYEIARAWAMKDSGMSTSAIAKELERGERTVREWFAKDRPEATQQGQPPALLNRKPQNVVLPPAPLSIEIEPEPTIDQKPTIPENLKQFHQRESRRFKEKWQEAALNLRIVHDLIKAERDRLNNEYAGKHGSLLMQGRWQQLATAWRDCGFLEQFGEITTKPTAVTLEGLLEEMERASRMTNEWIQAIQVYTGCKPCPTRYKGENGNGACAVQNNDKVLI